MRRITPPNGKIPKPSRLGEQTQRIPLGDQSHFLLAFKKRPHIQTNLPPIQGFKAFPERCPP